MRPPASATTLRILLDRHVDTGLLDYYVRGGEGRRVWTIFGKGLGTQVLTTREALLWVRAFNHGLEATHGS